MQKYSGHNYGLKINRVKKGEDDGQYKVLATNSYGKADASCRLDVKGSVYAAFVQQILDLRSHGGKSVT